ncbi:MAG: phosphoglucosamine mutase, partial [Clostridia bacterium]|nr:phosphoglucosamine mutase [Clostridia bacterium]
AILYILGNRLKERGMLNQNTVVATVMSNSGFVKSLQKAGMTCVQTAVGDRFVYECMQENDYSLGGEQSGHIILKKYATTGDGLLTAIMLTEEICDTKSDLSKLAAPVFVYPQSTKNLRVKDKATAISDQAVQAALKQAQAQIGENGRVLLRQSGTEPVVRIMAECETKDAAIAYAEKLAKVIEERGHLCD